MDSLTLLLRLALRNLFASGINMVIGGVILLGTCFVLVGSSLVDSMDASMSRSIIGSAAGNIQVYSSKSRDELALWGGMGGPPDLEPIPDFARIKTTLETVPNVRAVVPMGINGALITSGNTIDLTLEKLRAAVKARTTRSGPGDEGSAPPGQDTTTAREQEESLKGLVRQMVHLLQSDLKKMQEISATAFDKESQQALEKAASDGFWANFDNDPFNSLEFLENRIAPLVSDADLLFLSYAGTDLDAFQKSFDRMEIVDGQVVPPGQRGILLSKYFYEDQLKLKTARRLDKLKEAIEEKHKTIATDPELQRFVKENQSQTREILLQLDALKTRTLTGRLQEALGSQEADPARLLAQLFDTNDQNFALRYRIFYEKVAPLLELYRIRVGDLLTIKSFTRSGYVQSVNVKVYGTFRFKGLEKSPLAGVLNLMDLISFRDLYGYLSSDNLEEIKRLKASAGTKEVDRAHAEDELFGSGSQVVAEATPGVIDEKKELDPTTRTIRTEELIRRVYSRSEIENGMVLNAAVLLKDPDKLQETIRDIQAAADRDKLPLKAVSWQQAAGTIGQVVLAAKIALWVIVLIILLVTLVIISNAIMMATIQRVREIGTMRAIGAQRGFVLAVILMETVVLGAVSGGGGALLGSLILLALHLVGIGAANDQLYFFFSGPRLHPTMSPGNLIAAFVIVFLVSALSTIYPALLATRVSPLQAMQTDE